MTTAMPDAASLDQAAARMYKTRPLTPADRRAFDAIAADYQRTAPAAPASRKLLTKTVDELVEEALGGINPHGTRPPIDVRLPGRLAAVLPDWAHRGRRRDCTHPPSTQLYVAAAILREWGWQAKPHKLRNKRGQRCICGALVTTVALGVGTMSGAETAAWHVLGVLRDQGWTRLIGDWNRQCGSPEKAIDVTLTAYHRAVSAGQ
ncbi:DUF6197 family protein [Streptomyces sparsogenes]|uniref:Uncharacterized protein n=1 Tax=Streptomyces sparsogenes DSM 40356 TaxID=1331668 RepID=A0A1R1S849_9ACTN|nr:hypothetical protein [Streptomyces sparsogenes]OMI34403.1 hypothetical protein SPAR_36506 [Streptomyces sparsogenes DSM 40356]